MDGALLDVIGHELCQRGCQQEPVPIETVYIDMIAFDNNPGQVIRKSISQP
jgi:hypothetical protein